MFHSGDLSLEALSGGVTAPGIVKDDGLAGGWLRVGGGEVDGWVHTVELGAGFVTGVDESGANTPTKS